jgi:hypothetical protein
MDLPDTLRAVIEPDLRPVRPLPQPEVRLAWVTPWAVLLLVLAVVLFGLRQDARALGPFLTWGASALQMTLGLVVVLAALREAVPGTTLPRRVIGVVAGTAAIAVVGLTWLTWSTSPTTIRPAAVTFVWRVCVVGSMLTALPVLAVSGWLVARAFPLRPRLAGALYGLGAGLMADAGWRLFCHYSDPLHVFGAHTLAVVVTMVVGMLVAVRVRRDRPARARR